MNFDQTERELTTSEQEQDLSRKMMVWVNSFPETPVLVIRYEDVVPGKPGMYLSLLPGSYKTKRYILGGYQAEYQFDVVYRIQPAQNDAMRLDADELLNRLGDWARLNPPDLGGNMRVLRMRQTTRSSVFAGYENGDEDHKISITMTYEVI